MKILKLEFRNINSLKGYHEIDFQNPPFTGSSLFAITGPTGSGKSTILDAISLALFNKIPRLDKVSKSEIRKTGAIITKNQQEAMAAVTYESRSGVFRSEWSISTARTGSLREYTMELSNDESGELFRLKKSQVPEKNEELIGLNYNQFIKSVLLAQGEFAQFLKAKKDERGELLEKITGTGIYRQLGRLAFEKHKEVNAEIQEQQQAISLIRPKLLEREKKEEINKTLAEKVENCAPLEKAVETLKKQLELKDNIKSREQEINVLQEEKAKAEFALADFEKDHGKPLQEHEKLRSYSEELRQWSRLQEEKSDLAKDIEQRRSEEEATLREIQKCLEATKAFTKAKISAENIIEKLSEFRTRVSALQEQRRQKLEVHGNIRSRLEATLAEVEFSWQGQPNEQITLLEEMNMVSANKLKEYQENLELDLEDLDTEKHQLRQRLEASRKAQVEWVQLEQISAEINKLKIEGADLELQKKELPQEEEKLRLKVENLNRTLENLQLRKENQMLVANFEELRTKLKEGEPCHLCGSIEHPYATHAPKIENSLDKKIKETSNFFQELNHQLISVTATLTALEKRLAENSRSKKGLQQELEVRQQKFSSFFGHLNRNENEEWEQLCNRLEKKLLELDACEKEQRRYKALATGIPLHRELNKVLSDGKKLKQQLDELYSGTDIHNDCQELQSNWLKFSQDQSNLKKQQLELTSRIESKTKSLAELEEKLQCLTDIGYESVGAAREALLPESQFQELHARREQLTNKLSAHLTSLKVLRSQLEELKSRDVTKSKEELQEELTTKRTDLDTVKQDCEELRRLIRNDDELNKELNDLQSAIAEREKQIRRWRLLNELIGDATGKKFNDFAQDLSLIELIHLANIRLRDLSDRYRIAKSEGDEDDGLVAIDEHMGGQRRSVKTLSGGETFILSLSMALALSDLASQNVQINSLFIDEGFGTLDPETLDQTLDTLEKLQAESSKTIGIISHVESLKERITTQVQLKRNGQGYSQLAVQ